MYLTKFLRSFITCREAAHHARAAGTSQMLAAESGEHLYHFTMGCSWA